MSGTPPIVQTEHVDEHMARVYISFTVPARYVDYGQFPVGAPHPMVAITTVGSTSPIRLNRESTVLTVYYRIKVHMDLQADKSPVVVKGPFFPRVVNPRY
jgi:hypothetical protein